MLLTRTPLYSAPEGAFRVRLACLRHAASVDSEPGSNSRLEVLILEHHRTGCPCPMMTLSSFEYAALYRASVALKGHPLGHALSSFQRSLPLSANPDLDARDSFRLPSGGNLSPQANGDFNSGRAPLSSASGFERARAFPVARPALSAFGRRATKQPLPLTQSFRKRSGSS